MQMQDEDVAHSHRDSLPFKCLLLQDKEKKKEEKKAAKEAEKAAKAAKQAELVRVCG